MSLITAATANDQISIDPDFSYCGLHLSRFIQHMLEGNSGRLNAEESA